ncbi:unnamed protein product [Cyprideis torosa]|uniref:furin n=1 Tax=Cyprideis torosa TaxID=163714 RepID=A0A7R8ZG25_9CRUS|nr:unnamed protein product [Cyprideis torosa]CAG0879135.1 unnamed protein product [Cyprideis torosa]
MCDCGTSPTSSSTSTLSPGPHWKWRSKSPTRICSFSRVNTALSLKCFIFGVVLLFTQRPLTVYGILGDYSNEFAVHIPGGVDVANTVAEKHGFVNLGQIGSLEGFYTFAHHSIRKRSTEKSDHLHGRLSSDEEVHWVEQQVVKNRKRRVPQFAFFGSPNVNIGPSFDRTSRTQFNYQFNDPLYPEQWFISGKSASGHNMNIIPAWRLGYTGKGVVVSILDDGIQHTHPDLLLNYDPQASYDINNRDGDPMPQDNNDNKHGTRCAGEVAAEAGNNVCGVGVAYNASIGGVRMLDGPVNDAVEAHALSLNPDYIDIYSASWGPEDDGKTVDGPGPLARRAFINGIMKGRHGKGSIFVWASGNGGRHIDNCNCDGYTNSIFTLSISSASERGLKPWYLEECSSTLATTYSSGTPGHDKSVATCDQFGKRRGPMCTVEHTGTSASAPIAGGICALALEANPSLTWRDMQYLVVMTSLSHMFGYGLMDAAAMVKLARQWTTVPPQHICQTEKDRTEGTIPNIHNGRLEVTMQVNGCVGSSHEVRYLEHVQAKITLRFLPRGNLNIKLTSPMGTTTTLLFERPRDILNSNFDDWPFLSVHFWGEKAEGEWKLTIINAGSRNAPRPGILRAWQLILYGTDVNPVRLRSEPRPANLIARAPSPPPASFFPSPDGGFQVPNIFTLSGSSPDVSVASINGTVLSHSTRQSTCHKECVGGCTGDGPARCNLCKHVKYQGTCVTECPEKTYPDKGECRACHHSCGTCVGSQANQCLTCSKDLFYIRDLALCQGICPEGYFTNKETRECVPCGPHCTSCEKSPKDCTACDHHLALHNGKCVGACPDGFHESNDYRCAENLRLDPETGKCRLKEEGGVVCPTGQFRNGTDCSPCDESCKTCFGAGDNHCISCPGVSLLMGSSCVKECPEEFVKTGVGINECLTCRDNSSLVNGVCVKCDTNTYYDSTHRSCVKCHPTCATCSGNDEMSCSSCVQGFHLYKGRCVPCCSEVNKGVPCCTCDRMLQNCLDGSEVTGSVLGTSVVSPLSSSVKTTQDPIIGATPATMIIMACVVLIIFFSTVFVFMHRRLEKMTVDGDNSLYVRLASRDREEKASLGLTEPDIDLSPARSTGEFRPYRDIPSDESGDEGDDRKFIEA